MRRGDGDQGRKRGAASDRRSDVLWKEGAASDEMERREGKRLVLWGREGDGDGRTDRGRRERDDDEGIGRR